MAEDSSNRSINILLVDDEQAILKSVARLLNLHYNVFTANNPTKAIQQLEGNDISLCIIDQNLKSDRNGIELASDLKNANSNLKIIMLTGESDSQIVIDALNSGVIDTFLTKPFEYEEVISFVNTNLKEAQQKNKHIEDIIEKIRKGNTLNPGDINLIAKDMGHLESLMFDYRLTASPAPQGEQIEILAIVVFDENQIIYQNVISDEFEINNEFMFRGLITTLTNLSHELFSLKEEAKVLQEIKLPNVHAVVELFDPNIAVVVFLSGQHDLPLVINNRVNSFVHQIYKWLNEDNPDTNFIDNELKKLSIDIIELQ